MHNERLNQRAFGRRTRPLSALLVAIAALGAPTRAWCQEASSVKAASEAERIFQKAKKDYDEGRLDEACEGFAKSQHLDASSGTLLNLAACHERQGKTAVAYDEYLEAERLAIRQRDKAGTKAEADRRQGDAMAARAGASQLKAKLSPPVVSAPEGVIPVGRREVRLDVPTPPPSQPSNWQSPLGYTLGGLGVASIGVGAIFGWQALSSYEKAEKACPERSGCAPEAVDRRERAGTEALVANVGLGVGVLGLAAGSYLLLTAPSQSKTSMASGRRGALVFEPRPTGFVVAGRF